MKKPIYDTLYSEDDLYSASGFSKKNGGDFIYITKVTNELMFSAQNNLQQKVEIRHLFRNENFWTEENATVWLDVPKNGSK